MKCVFIDSVHIGHDQCIITIHQTQSNGCVWYYGRYSAESAVQFHSATKALRGRIELIDLFFVD